MRLPPTKKLVQIAAWGGFIFASAGMLMRDRMIQKVKKQDYYKEALKIVRAHPGVVTYMGEPIKEYGFKLEDTSNYCNAEKAYFAVKLKGPKDSAKMYFWAENEENKWNVKRIELELKSQENKRLLVKKTESE